MKRKEDQRKEMVRQRNIRILSRRLESKYLLKHKNNCMKKLKREETERKRKRR